MIKNLSLFLFLFASLSTHAQMNMQDSTVQVISYWDLGEKYDYTVSLQKLKYTDTDTMSNETTTYDVEVSVIDSTENSYTVRWFYKNYRTNTDDPIVEKILKTSDDIAVDIRLNELGVVEAVENWEEVRDYMTKSINELEAEMADLPGVSKVFQQMKGMYSTKTSIEAVAIQDVVQFHNFHGAQYRLGEVLSGQLKTPNIYDNSKPFDTEFSVVLEDLDAENAQYLIRSVQEINSEQLTKATFDYLNGMSEGLGKALIKEDEFIEVTNVVETASRIHNTGWVLESVLWKEIVAEGVTNMEIRTIEIQ